MRAYEFTYRNHSNSVNEELVGRELQRTSDGEFMTRADRTNQDKVDAILGPGYKAGKANTNLALAQYYRQQAKDDDKTDYSLNANPIKSRQVTPDAIPTTSMISAKNIGFTGPETVSSPTSNFTGTGMQGRGPDSFSGMAGNNTNSNKGSSDTTNSSKSATSQDEINAQIERDKLNPQNNPRAARKNSTNSIRSSNSVQSSDTSWIPPHVDLSIKDRGKGEPPPNRPNVRTLTNINGQLVWFDESPEARERDRYRTLLTFSPEERNKALERARKHEEMRRQRQQDNERRYQQDSN